MVTATMDPRQLAQKIVEIVTEACDEAVAETIEVGARHAKRLAPTRKVSYEERRKSPKPVTMREAMSYPSSIRGSIVTRIARGERVMSTPRRARQVLESPPDIINSRTPALEYDELSGRATGLRDPRQGLQLTYAGQRELRIATSSRVITEAPSATRKLSSNATFVSGSGPNRTATLGGRLRGEITIEGPFYQNDKSVGWVVSPTEYARYVEFPTSRTTAQPYMRPTLKFLRTPLRKAVIRNLKRQVREFGMG